MMGITELREAAARAPRRVAFRTLVLSLVVLAPSPAAADVPQSLPAVSPSSLRDHAQPGVGYAHSAIVAGPVSGRELERWISILSASDDEARRIRAAYERFLRDEYNPFIDRAMPAYLAKAAAASAALGEPGGMASDAFQAASTEEYRAVRSLMDAALGLELRFIDGLAELLDERRAPALDRLRGMASRRMARSVPGSNRWVEFELAEIWKERREGDAQAILTEEERASVTEALTAYEQELTALMQRRASAGLMASRRIQRMLVDLAEGGEADSPERIWSARAKAAKSIQTLHLRFHAHLLTQVRDSAGTLLDRRVKDRLYPELFPDAAAQRTRGELDQALEGGLLEADDREAVATLRAEFEARYASIGARLEAICIREDDAAQTGVRDGVAEGASAPEPAAALSSLLEERRRLCEEILERLGRARRSERAAPPNP